MTGLAKRKAPRNSGGFFLLAFSRFPSPVGMTNQTSLSPLFTPLVDLCHLNLWETGLIEGTHMN